MTMEKDFAGYPSQIAPHLVLRRMLGEGGTSVVFEAFHTRLKVPVAVKLLSVTGSLAEQARQRLRREAELYALLDDPHLPHVYDVDELADGTPYVVMEFVPGASLDALLARGPLSPRRALNIAGEVLEALVYVHARGVLHRDVKPANVILSEVDDRCQVRLVDFGIAKIAFDEAEDALTQQGTLVGTPHYMPPESLLGRIADERADIYAVGVMLYEMLAGDVPFRGSTIGEVIASVLRDTPAPLSSRVPNIQPELEHVVARAMARDPGARYASAREMLVALQRVEASLQGDVSSLRIVPPSRSVSVARSLSSFPPSSLEVMPEDLEPFLKRRAPAVKPLLAALGFASVLWAAWPSEVRDLRDLRVKSKPQTSQLSVAQHEDAPAAMAISERVDNGPHAHALAAAPTGVGAGEANDPPSAQLETQGVGPLLPQAPSLVLEQAADEAAPEPQLAPEPNAVAAPSEGIVLGEPAEEATVPDGSLPTLPLSARAPTSALRQARRADSPVRVRSSGYEPVRSVPLQPFLEQIDSLLKEPVELPEQTPAKRPEPLPGNPY